MGRSPANAGSGHSGQAPEPASGLGPSASVPNAARLSERDREVLGDLIHAYDTAAKYGFFEKRLSADFTWDGESYWDGVAPMDCGGRDGSDHSYRLSKLVRLGLAEHRKGTIWGQASTRHKGSKKYRPTEAGRALYAQTRTASAATGTGAVEDESAVPQGDAQ